MLKERNKYYKRKNITSTKETRRVAEVMKTYKTKNNKVLKIGILKVIQIKIHGMIVMIDI